MIPESKAIALPDFKVEAEEYYKPCVSWEADGRRYHFWLDDADKPESILHSNPINPTINSRRDEHRSLNAEAKKWAPLIAGIMNRIETEGLIGKARVAYRAAAKETAAKARAQRDAELLAAFESAFKDLPTNLQAAVADLPDAAKIEIASNIRKA